MHVLGKCFVIFVSLLKTTMGLHHVRSFKQFIYHTHPVNKAEDAVNSTTKYIPAVMFESREDVASTTYPFKIYLSINIEYIDTD